MPSTPKTIVLIHGLWMTPKIWALFRGFYGALGYKVLTPAWPGIQGTVQDMRLDASAMNDLGITEIVNHYVNVIRELEEQPIIIGHAFGALVTQLLLGRGLGAAGVAIAPAPSKGILLLPWTSLKAASPVLKKTANYHRTVSLTFEEFCDGFANNMTLEESRFAYEEEIIPGPSRVLFQAAFANVTLHAATAIDYRNSDRAPLLLITGKEDRISPPVVSRKLLAKYRRSKAVTDYKEFVNRSHLIVSQAGWEEVAEYAIAWARTHIRPSEEAAVISPSIFD